jgi:hypothetical protein
VEGVWVVLSDPYFPGCNWTAMNAVFGVFESREAAAKATEGLESNCRIVGPLEVQSNHSD